MKCRQCAWFRRPRGRIPTTCADVGEEAGNDACLQFEVDVPETKQPTPAEYIGALTEKSYRDIFHEILAESFVLEQDAKLAVDTVRAQLQAQGANIQMEPTTFNRQASRLVDLYVLYRLILALGLSRYMDQMMHQEIARVFGERDESKKARVLKK